MNAVHINKQHQCFDGALSFCRHESQVTKSSMNFSVFLPENKQKQTLPLFVFLAGLTCTEENFTLKAGAYSMASKLGFAVLAPDTSPRGDQVPDDSSYDLGQGAGFYIDAIQAPWNQYFQMESYIIQELLPLVEDTYNLGQGAGVFLSGHSMGGHGALTLALKYPKVFRSVTAFAPIVAPSQVPWGQKIFSSYLGDDQNLWRHNDACELVSKQSTILNPILIDQGLNDEFLHDQLQPNRFQQACEKAGQPLTLRLHHGYDHSYFFIQSFIADHLKWHSRFLGRA